MISVGIDPDTSATGVAIVMTEGTKIEDVEAWVVRAKGRKAEDRVMGMAWGLAELLPRLLKVAHVVVVEWQAIRPTDRRPNDILNLAAVAGMAMGIAHCAHLREPIILNPLPVRWKGSIPKDVHQRRILSESGLSLDSPAFCGIIPSLRTHAVDAVGLALWGLRKVKA
jgi:hypothetical protein